MWQLPEKLHERMRRLQKMLQTSSRSGCWALASSLQLEHRQGICLECQSHTLWCSGRASRA